MDKVGICIAGYGEFARKELRPRLDKIEACEVRRLYHPDSEKAGAYGSLGASDLSGILEDPSIDAFVIASPNDCHFNLLSRLLDIGRHHIFVEKPLTNAYHEALLLGDSIRRNKKVFMVGHCHRRGGVYRTAQRVLKEGLIGKVVSVDFNYSSSKVFTIRKDEWRASAKRTDLGPLTMVGTHCIDTIHYLFGGVASVFAMTSNLTGLTESPDTTSAMLKLESGATVLLQCNYNVPMDRYCHIFGTDGAIYINDSDVVVRRGREAYTGAQTTRTDRAAWHVFKTDPIGEELDEFISSIRTGVQVETGYEEGLAVMRVLEACRTSVEEKRLIKLP